MAVCPCCTRDGGCSMTDWTDPETPSYAQKEPHEFPYAPAQRLKPPKPRIPSLQGFHGTHRGKGQT